MDESENRERQRTPQAARPHLPRSYSLLVHLSRKMGTIATSSSFMHDVRSFMGQEISISSSERMFGNTVPKLTVTRQDSVESKKTTNGLHEAKSQQQEKDFKKIVTRTHEVLMSANTVFPITLFPDTVTVDRTKVTITRRDFFWSSDVLSIRIEDVLNVQASTGPLFGSLTIASRVMSTVDHFKVRHLWRSDAIRLKHIIQGYVIAQHNKINTSHLNRNELIDTLMEIGIDSN